MRAGPYLGVELSGKGLGHCSFAQGFALIWLTEGPTYLPGAGRGGGGVDKLPADLSLRLIVLTAFQEDRFKAQVREVCTLNVKAP